MNRQPAAGARVTRSGNNARLAGTARLDGPAGARDGQHLLLQRRAGPRVLTESGHVPAVDADGHDPAAAVLSGQPGHPDG